MSLHQLELWTESPTADSRVPHSSSERAASADLTRSGLAHVDALDARVHCYAQNALTELTRAAYRCDVAAFVRWCRTHSKKAFPASSTTLGRYLTELAERGRKISTIRRARIAIGLAHADAGLPRPDTDRGIRLLERGMGRIHGTREASATPLVVESLERIVQTLGTTARDDRDRAVLLVGFAGAFRASELVALHMQDVRWTSESVVLCLRRGQEDPLGAGHEIEIGRAQNPQLCAVSALDRWMVRLGKGEGPLLRRVLGECIGEQALRSRTVSRVVQYHAARLGLGGEYSSHSLRAGFATSAYARGLSLLDIQRHGRWSELRSLARYIDFNFTPYRPNPISAIC